MKVQRRTLIGAGVSTATGARAAADEALDHALAAFDGDAPELGILFVSTHHAGRYPEILARVRERAAPRALLGCTAQGVIGEGVEVEEAPGLALWLARLPAVTVEPIRLRFRRSGDRAVVEGLAAVPRERCVLVLLADPYTFPADVLVAHLNQHAPGVPVVGGMASSATPLPGATKLFYGGDVLDEGAVGAILAGDLAIATVVSQGCRPIGPLLSVTRAEGQLLQELDGESALRRLEEVYRAAPEEDQRRMRDGIHLGIAMRHGGDEPGRGDFVIRNVVGVDSEQGALAVADHVRDGSLVRFHIRDGESASEDLRLLLDGERLLLPRTPAGALLFSCNGRGRRFFGRPDHDVTALERAFGGLPVAGFFAQGELGPVAGRNFLHGFTASIALFLDPRV